MASPYWRLDPQAAFDQPYDYEGQKLFAAEASEVLARYYKLLNADRHRHEVDEQTVEKAVWLLAVDGLDALRDGLDALSRKDHRVAGRLFRDVMETLDLAALFWSRSAHSASCLAKWYQNKIVPHSEYREHVKKSVGPDMAERLATDYRRLSRFTHRSYRAILDGYSRAGSLLVHDRTAEALGAPPEHAKLLVLPQTISSYYAALADVVATYSKRIVILGLVTRNEVEEVFAGKGVVRWGDDEQSGT